MVGAALLVGIALAAAAGPSTEGAELYGTPAPEWEVTEWIGSPPLTLSAASM